MRAIVQGKNGRDHEQQGVDRRHGAGPVGAGLDVKKVRLRGGQVIGMVATSAAFLALLGGAAAVPGGVALSRLLFDLVGNIGGDDIPTAAYGAFASWELVAILLAGVAVAVAAAMLPGRWAATHQRGRGPARGVINPGRR